MSNFSEADRIEQFEKLMNPYVSKEFRNWLIANGFFTAPILWVCSMICVRLIITHIRGMKRGNITMQPFFRDMVKSR